MNQAASHYYIVFDSYKAAEHAIREANTVSEMCWISESLDAAFLAGTVEVTDDQWREFTAACAERQHQIEGS